MHRIYSLKWKFFAFFIGLGLTISLLMYVPYHNYIKTTYRDKLSNVLKMVDIEHHDFISDPDNLIAIGKDGSREYWGLVSTLQNIIGVFDIKFVYYIRWNGVTYDFVFSTINSPDTPLDDVFCLWDVNDIPQALTDANNTKTLQITNTPYTDMYGTFISAFLPVTQNGAIVGILGADYEMTKVKQFERRAIMLLIFSLIISSAMAYIISISLIRPIKRLERAADSIANMDFTVNITNIRRDEIGSVQRALDSVRGNLKDVIDATRKQVRNLSGTSASLLGLSGSLLKSSETTLTQSISVSRKSEETSENVSEIAGETERASATATELSAAAEQMGHNMNKMVSAVGEMHESFSKITADTRESKAVAGVATEKVADAMGVMDELASSAKEIGQFTDVIKSIAKKTNLLAINATVEAARAGEAGKGFAVVAGEVKQLANQSAANADDITRRIENIQNGTGHAIDSIKEISAIITKISASANSIAESVERQIKVSDDLAGTARDTNVGAQEVVKAVDDVANSITITAKNAGDAAEGTKNVSDSIGVIHGDAEKTNAYSTQLKETADSMRAMAEDLDSIVSKFKT